MNEQIKLYFIPLSIFFAGGLIAIGIFFSGSATQSDDNNNIKQGNQQAQVIQSIRKVNKKKDFIRGNKDADIFIVEYSDFEDPFNKRFQATLRKVLDAYPKIGLIYRHFPLTQLHPNAQAAAVASECIGKEAGNDAFWSYVDEIFSKQSSMSADLYKQIAIRLGINEKTYTSCINNSDILKKVSEDSQEAISSGARGTPFSLIVNKDGKILTSIPGALPFSGVKPIIDGVL